MMESNYDQNIRIETLNVNYIDGNKVLNCQIMKLILFEKWNNIWPNILNLTAFSKKKNIIYKNNCQHYE